MRTTEGKGAMAMPFRTPSTMSEVRNHCRKVANAWRWAHVPGRRQGPGWRVHLCAVCPPPPEEGDCHPAG